MSRVFALPVWLHRIIKKKTEYVTRSFYRNRNRNRNRNKFINQIRTPGGHIQITIMMDTQQQYIKLNIRGEISIIVVQVLKKPYMTSQEMFYSAPPDN